MVKETTMLIRATFANLFSFDAPQTLSFVAGKGRSLSHHMLKKQNRNLPSLLKSAIIYGANASGKSNLVKCFNLARNLVVKGSGVDEQIPRTPFRLRAHAGQEPSWFEFELDLDGEMYAYRLSFDDHAILEESLTRILPSSEKLLFSRTWNGTASTIEFPEEKFADKNEGNRFTFIAQSTRPNQPFLTETVESNSDKYRSIYNWFRYGINIIYPEAMYRGPIAKSEGKASSIYREFFKNLGLGITGIKEDRLDIDSPLKGIPIELIHELGKSLKNGMQMIIPGIDKSRYRLLKTKEGVLELYKIVIAHETADTHEEVPFDLKDESDGTVRLIDLIPALADLCDHETLYVIDELDRSMHAQLTRAFLEYFFSCSTSRSQILATTHELDLLDLELLRKDEIWFVEKDGASASHLYSLEEFKPRYDKDIRKGYLQGRFGGIPIIRKITHTGWGK
jgi:AAA15 family ATPase/GTPase